MGFAPSELGYQAPGGRPRDEKASTRARVLVVDDDDAARRGARDAAARGRASRPRPRRTARRRSPKPRRALPDVVLTDLHMPRIHGVELCRRLHEIDPDLPVIVMTGFSDMASVIGEPAGGGRGLPHQAAASTTRVVWCVERAIARRGREGASKRSCIARSTSASCSSSVREQEHADAEAQQRAQLNALLENLKEGVVIADPSGRVVMVNDAARAILGVEDERSAHPRRAPRARGPRPRGRRPRHRAAPPRARAAGRAVRGLRGAARATERRAAPRRVDGHEREGRRRQRRAGDRRVPRRHGAAAPRAAARRVPGAHLPRPSQSAGQHPDARLQR